MNAIVLEKYGPPNVLQLREVEKPTPKANEVLIRIYAAAVTATDPVDRKGEPFVARIFSGIRRPKHPIPGGMLAGVIEATGKDVRRFKVGDQVFGSTGLTLGAHVGRFHEKRPNLRCDFGRSRQELVFAQQELAKARRGLSFNRSYGRRIFLQYAGASDSNAVDIEDRQQAGEIRGHRLAAIK